MTARTPPRRRGGAGHALEVPEADFQQTVVDFAGRAHWRVYHTHDSRRCTPGFPDLQLLRPPRFVIAELKTEKVTPRVPAHAVQDRPEWLACRDLTDEQAGWLQDFHAVGVALADSIDLDQHAAAGHPTIEVYVWRPSDWPLIVEVLR